MFDFRGKALVGLITLTCSVGFMLFGYDQGVLSGLIGANNQFGADFNHPNPTTQGLIVSVYQLGNVGGSIVIFLFGDALGRKKSILLSSIVMLIGAILQTASVNRGMMYAARVITGFVSFRFKISKENNTDSYRETEEILPLFRCGRRRPALPKIVGSSSPSTHLLSFSGFSLHTGRLSKPISEL
jgi:MFS family permease